MNTRLFSISSIHYILIFLSGSLLILTALLTYIHFVKYTNILIDSKEIRLSTNPDTDEGLKNAIIDAGIKLGTKDIILPPASWLFTPRINIRIVRVSEKIIKEDSRPEYEVLNHNKRVGNLRLADLQKVRETIKRREVKLIYHDGIEKERRVQKERSISRVFYKLLLFNKDYTLDKSYDLSKCKRMKMIATAYYPGDPLAWRDGTITYLGQKMERGIVAVDPKVIPLRTRVYVPGYGYGFAGDTGSAIKGNRIDLGVNNAEEEKDFMHKRVTVYILERSKDW